MRQASVSSIIQGGGKRRGGISARVRKRINFPDRTKFVTYVRSHLLFNLVIQPDDLFSDGRESRVAFCATFVGSKCQFLQRVI